MISYEQALQIALFIIGKGKVIKTVQEIDLGWYFMPYPQKYLETGDSVHLNDGEAGMVIRRTDGRVLELDTLYACEYSFEAFRWGLHDPVDIEIQKVRDERKAIELLVNLGVIYVIPEEDRDLISHDYAELMKLMDNFMNDFILDKRHSRMWHSICEHLFSQEKYGKAWKIRKELKQLPTTFKEVNLYDHLETLMEIMDSTALDVVIHGDIYNGPRCRGRPTASEVQSWKIFE